MSLSIPQPFVPALWHLMPCVSVTIHIQLCSGFLLIAKLAQERKRIFNFSIERFPRLGVRRMLL